MRRSIDGKIAMLSFCAIAAAVSTIAIVVLWMAVEHNNKAAADAQTMVTGSLAGFEDKVKSFAEDYSWWQEAYDHVRANDADWIQSSIGNAVTDTDTMQFAAVADPDGKILYGWLRGQGDESNPSLIPAETAAQAKGALKRIPVGTNEAAVFHSEIGGVLYMIGTARVVPESGVDTDKKGSYSIALGFILDNEQATELGKQNLISNLTVTRSPQPGDLVVPVLDADGKPVGHYLAWPPAHPGFDILKRGAVPISLALGVFFFVALLISRKANAAVLSLARKEEESFRAARTDTLTGLPNRLSLQEMLENPTTAHASRSGNLTVIFLDVDGFKNVNDTTGHNGGDDLIRQIGARLSAVLPKNAFLARVGGDEFSVILGTPEMTRNADTIAQDIARAFAASFVVKGSRFNIGASIGYASADDRKADPAELLRRADVAMYEAKSRKTGEPLRYREMFETKIKANLKIGEALRDALATGQVHVHYQPIVKAATSELVAVEALVRWNSPDLGTVSPIDFIPVAEDVGLIGELDTYVFNRVCEDLATWPELRASVNVSPIQLRHPGYVTSVIEAAAQAGIDACRLELELTERILLSHPEIANEKLSQLRTAGFSISLDDFGTGYSSIGYLKRMPFDKLKIDRSFVINMEHDPSAIAMVQNITGLAKALGLTVVAEGVETVEQANIVRLAGCDQMQGFLIGMPVAFEEIEARYRVEDEARKQMLENAVSI